MSEFRIQQFDPRDVAGLPLSMQPLKPYIYREHLSEVEQGGTTYQQLAHLVARVHHAVYRDPSTPEIARQLAAANDPPAPLLPEMAFDKPIDGHWVLSEQDKYFANARVLFGWMAMAATDLGQREAEGLPVGWDDDQLLLRHQIWIGDRIARLAASNALGGQLISGRATFERAQQQVHLLELTQQGMGTDARQAWMADVWRLKRRSFFNRQKRRK